jgi:hypothetical protein
VDNGESVELSGATAPARGRQYSAATGRSGFPGSAESRGDHGKDAEDADIRIDAARYVEDDYTDGRHPRSAHGQEIATPITTSDTYRVDHEVWMRTAESWRSPTKNLTIAAGSIVTTARVGGNICRSDDGRCVNAEAERCELFHRRRGGFEVDGNKRSDSRMAWPSPWKCGVSRSGLDDGLAGALRVTVR